MRIIDYYNIAATVLELAIVLAALLLCAGGRRGKGTGSGAAVDTAWKRGAAQGHTRGEKGSRPSAAGSLLQGRGFWFAAAAVAVFGAFLRMWNLVGLPDGLQQDEASIGYEAYCLANYGIDRNGYHWPVYPITWGSGGGSPIMIYLNVITTKIFGSSVWSIRIVPAFLGTATLVLFFAVLLRGFGRKTALAGLVILCITPWHIILSRWSLDSNTTPFWQMLATFVFVLAVTGGKRGGETGQVQSGAARPAKTAGKNDFAVRTKGQTALLLFAAFWFGVCMYSYGSANVVVPVTLLLLSIWGIRHRAFGWAQLAGCFAVFLVTCVPLAIFYAVNFLGLPEIALDWISFPKFTASHFSSVFLAWDASLPENLLSNVKGLLQTLTVGFTDEVSWNAMEGYWTLYLFTWPVLFAGMAWCFRKGWRDRKTVCCGESEDWMTGPMACHPSPNWCCRTNSLIASENSPARILFAELPLTRQHPKKDILQDGPSGGGAAVSSRQDDRTDAASAVNAVMMAELAAALLFTLFIQQDINREVLLFLPLVYCLVMGLRWIYRAGNGAAGGSLLAWVALGLILIGAVSFCKDYYGGKYNEYAATDFMPGYGEAIVYADELAGELDEAAGADKDTDGAKVYSTYDLVASPFMLTLYYTKYDLYDFLDTVEYRDNEAEFRIAVSFGHFIFGLPVVDTRDLSELMEEEYWGDVFVLTRAQAEQFDEELYEITVFRDRFAVVARRRD